MVPFAAVPGLARRLGVQIEGAMVAPLAGT
jgi:hypothetical protein